MQLDKNEEPAQWLLVMHCDCRRVGRSGLGQGRRFGPRLCDARSCSSTEGRATQCQSPAGRIPFSWVDPVLRFRASSEFCVGGLQSGPAEFVNQHASVPDRFLRTRARRSTRIGREGGRVCRREVAVDAALPGLQDMRHGRRVGSGKLIGRRRRNSDAGARGRGRQAGGTAALLAAGCRLENMRCPDFLERRACRGAAASPKTCNATKFAFIVEMIDGSLQKELKSVGGLTASRRRR